VLTAPPPPVSAPPTGQFSDSPAAALKAFLVAGSVFFIPCCGLVLLALVVLAWIILANAT
jgi:hypothetical protein